MVGRKEKELPAVGTEEKMGVGDQKDGYASMARPLCMGEGMTLVHCPGVGITSLKLYNCTLSWVLLWPPTQQVKDCSPRGRCLPKATQWARGVPSTLRFLASYFQELSHLD